MITLAQQVKLSSYEAQQVPIRYDIIDRHTQQVVGSAKTRVAASRSADKRDLAYGAYRYSVRPIYA
jgi:hypothetical protein